MGGLAVNLVAARDVTDVLFLLGGVVAVERTSKGFIGRRND